MATRPDLIGAATEASELLLKLDHLISHSGGRLSLDYGGAFGPQIDNLRSRHHHGRSLSEATFNELNRLAHITIDYEPAATASSLLCRSLAEAILRVLDAIDRPVAMNLRGVEAVLRRSKARTGSGEVLAVVKDWRKEDGTPSSEQPRQDVRRVRPRQLTSLLESLLRRDGPADAG